MLANGVKETTATLGTGTVTLTAVTGFVRFSQAFATGQLVPYGIQDGNDWEWGYGTVAASNTLERTLVTAKYASGTYTNTGTITPLTLSGSATVICGESASTSQFEWPGINSLAEVKAIWPENVSMSMSGSFAVTADTLYMVPIMLPVAGEVSGFKPWIVTGSAGNMRIGLYQVGSDGYPGALLVESVEQGTTASGYPSIDAVANKFIPRGKYWLAMVFSATPAITRTNNTSVVTPLGISNSGGAASDNLMTKAYTYGALPSTGGSTGWSGASSANVPTSAVRYA